MKSTHSNGHTEFLATKTEVHVAILRHNYEDLQQCKDSLLYQGSLKDIVFPLHWHRNLNHITSDPLFIQTHCLEPKTAEIFKLVQSFIPETFDVSISFEDIKNAIKIPRRKSVISFWPSL